jgi:hypothetical protein
LRAQALDIARIDLSQTAVTSAGIVSVIGNPIRCGRLNQKILGAYIDGRGYSRRCVTTCLSR